MKEDDASINQENAMWNNVLGFLSLELFGPEITKAIEQHTFKGFPMKKEEKTINVELKDWEKRLFIITDAVMDYGENHQDEMSVYKAKAIMRIADALREIFWAVLPLQHKEVRNKSFGVREGLKVVEIPKWQGLEESALKGLLKMFSPSSPKE